MQFFTVTDQSSVKHSALKEKVYMNVPFEAVLAFGIIYTADIAEN